MHTNAISWMSPSRRIMMSAIERPVIPLAFTMLALLGCLQLHAQELDKTASVVTEAPAFARDLAIGSMYQLGGEITVVLVNTRTHERTMLRGSEPSFDGMRVKQASIRDTRRESSVVVEMGGKDATLYYDASYFKQMGSSRTGKQEVYVNSNLDIEPGDPTAIVESVHGVGMVMTESGPAPAPAPIPLPEGYVNSNLDIEPGDPTAIVESVHGVGVGMTSDSDPAPAPTPLREGYVNSNLDIEPGDPTAIVESVHGVGVGMTSDSDPAPAPAPLPEGYVNSNPDIEPGDPTAIVESVHGVGSVMTFDSSPPAAPTSPAGPGAAPPTPPKRKITAPQPSPPAPAPAPASPPAPGEVEL
ncbi:hypothetical protein [Roseimicrobium sp. ORNL1]|uniref:hypothetical protein n=1 Tax=Roseimicrobium sp. ORNL1 TaxID=2711231 RepID=UPI0013E1C658|nr:hypothetical protein [Roseimicrobium sp. ORNL1]QIF05182.1 hypothetical protein G5S37_27935 [Roseimicrobium sp. ORNL1]